MRYSELTSGMICSLYVLCVSDGCPSTSEDDEVYGADLWYAV
jgi:hypothetical protein